MITTNRHPRRRALALAVAAAASGAALLVGCTGEPTDAPEPDARVSGVQEVAPALEKYDSGQVQALWEDDSLSPRDRSLATVAVLVANGQTTELGHYVAKALDDGVTPAEISETVTHLAFYSGWPNAMAAIDPIAAVYSERGIGEDQLPEVDPDLLPQDAAAEAARETRVQEQYGGVSQGVVDDTDQVLFDDLWLRPGLELRDRSLVTVVALVATGQPEQIPVHLERAMDNGLTAEQVDPLLNHLAYFAGWPKVFSAMPVVDETLQAR